MLPFSVGESGASLLRRTHEAAGLQTMLVLLAAPQATEYYPHIGMVRHDSCWMLSRQMGRRWKE